ncbi:hypothetical protein HA50_17025 [Pantoea cypripedii]|uniref:Uncharacterized protein n=1 Tax=Pantoea cypripedii TaxID=55209 RepID=A0A1X1EYW0_PANCY|nr:hypothetical protein [Pantoea cypripedii]ORM94955.1 hypothetical protein HA50_17025 [Pantoea cypripedii]
MSRICNMVFVLVLMIKLGLVWARPHTPTIIPADDGEYLVRVWDSPVLISVAPVTTETHSILIGTDIPKRMLAMNLETSHREGWPMHHLIPG